MVRTGRVVVLAAAAVCAMSGLALLSGWTLQAQTALPTPQHVAGPNDVTRTTGVAVQWMGSYSSIQTPRIEVVTDAGVWERLYSEHTHDKPEKNAGGSLTWPKVDFDKFVVVAVFAGKGTNSNGFEAVSVTESVAGVLVRFDEVLFQTLNISGGSAGTATTGFGLFVVPRRHGMWTLEENTQNLIGGAPIWTERKRADVREILPGR